MWSETLDLRERSREELHILSAEEEILRQAQDDSAIFKNLNLRNMVRSS